jgi:hypothetical protein
MVVRLSPYARAAGRFLVLISVIGSVDPRAAGRVRSIEKLNKLIGI